MKKKHHDVRETDFIIFIEYKIIALEHRFVFKFYWNIIHEIYWILLERNNRLKLIVWIFFPSKFNPKTFSKHENGYFNVSTEDKE